jgi:formate dehydrogenase subunit gamma
LVTASVRRYSRKGRLYHLLVYLTTLVLLATGWWLVLGREGEPSPLSKLLGAPDTTIHKDAGWALSALGVLVVAFALRSSADFVAQSVRFERADVSWLVRWPGSVVTARFAPHNGHFDPGQRLFNIAISLGLVILVASGVGLVLVHGGLVFVWLARVHLWATYAVTPLILGHIVVASGILPGYRGVWRAMHWGGRVDERVARRLWPAWADDELSGTQPEGDRRGARGATYARVTSARRSRQRD